MIRLFGRISPEITPKLAVYPEEKRIVSSIPDILAISFSNSSWYMDVPVNKGTPPDPMPNSLVTSMAFWIASGKIVAPK